MYVGWFRPKVSRRGVCAMHRAVIRGQLLAIFGPTKPGQSYRLLEARLSNLMIFVMNVRGRERERKRM
jgi:hypothetical protein